MGQILSSDKIRLGYNKNWSNVTVNHNFDKNFQNYLFINNFVVRSLKKKQKKKEKFIKARILRSTPKFLIKNLRQKYSPYTKKKLFFKQYLFRNANWKKRALNYKNNFLYLNKLSLKKNWNFFSFIRLKFKRIKYVFHSYLFLNFKFKNKKLKTLDFFKNKKLNFFKVPKNLIKNFRKIPFFKNWNNLILRKFIKINTHASHKHLIWLRRLTETINYTTLYFNTFFKTFFNFKKYKLRKKKTKKKILNYYLKKQSRRLKNQTYFVNLKTIINNKDINIHVDFYKPKNYHFILRKTNQNQLKIIDIKRRLEALYLKRFFETKIMNTVKKNINFSLKNINLYEKLGFFSNLIYKVIKTKDFRYKWKKVPNKIFVLKLFISAVYFKLPVLIVEYLIKKLERSRNPSRVVNDFDITFNNFFMWWLSSGVRVFNNRTLINLRPLSKSIKKYFNYSQYIGSELAFNVIICINGRWSNKKEETKQKWLVFGEVTNRQELDTRINFYQNAAITRRGLIGIRLWLSYY